MADASLRVTAPTAMTQAVFIPLTNFDSTELIDIARVHSQSLRLLQAVMRADLKGNLKNLLWLLCMHYNDEKCCAWPSIERLAKLTVTEPRTVERNLKTLVNMGLVVVGNVPGIRSNAYAVQEFAVQAIAIDGIRPAKNALSAAVFTPEPTPTFEVSNPDIGGTNPDIFSANPDTSVAQTEGTEGTEKNGGGTDVRTSTISAASAPVILATVPASSPALFASPIPIPENSEQPTAGLAMTNPAEHHAIALVNTQRRSNGKQPYTLADLHQLRTEAAKAGITAQQAAEWILERSGRNFFKADYFAAPAPVQPVPQASPATTVARAPVPNPYAPAQVPAKPGDSDSTDGAEEQAKFRAMMAKIPKSMAPAKTVASRTDGKQAWVDIVERARRGDHVSHYALTSACQMLGINYSALKAEIAARTTADTATA